MASKSVKMSINRQIIDMLYTQLNFMQSHRKIKLYVLGICVELEIIVLSEINHIQVTNTACFLFYADPRLEILYRYMCMHVYTCVHVYV